MRTDPWKIMVTFLLSSLFFIHLAFLYLNPVWVSLNLDYFLFVLYPYVRINYLHKLCIILFSYSVLITCFGIDAISLHIIFHPWNWQRIWLYKASFSYTWTVYYHITILPASLPFLPKSHLSTIYYIKMIVYLINFLIHYFVHFYEIFKLYLPPVRSINHLFILLCIIYMGTFVLQLRRKSCFSPNINWIYFNIMCYMFFPYYSKRFLLFSIFMVNI